MTKKQERIVVLVGIIISAFLLYGIVKMNMDHKIAEQERIALEMEERSKEEAKLEKIELEKKKEREKKREEEIEKKRLEYRAQAQEAAKQGKTQGVNSNNGSGNVPAPEVKVGTDNDGNQITVTKVPQINTSSSPAEVEKRETAQPIPTQAPAEKPEARVEPPYSPRVEGGNETVYPETKPSEENNTNTSTGNTGNPFLDFKTKDPSEFNESYSEDIGDPNKKPGQGDKF